MRVKVLNAYTAHLYQRQAVQVAIDGLEAKDAEQRQVQAKAQGGRGDRGGYAQGSGCQGSGQARCVLGQP